MEILKQINSISVHCPQELPTACQATRLNRQYLPFSPGRQIKPSETEEDTFAKAICQV
jgi:hypothetical protein